MGILFLAIDAYSVVVILSALLSWIPDGRSSRAGRWLEKATEPALKPIRQVLPTLSGFDLSPLVLLIALHFLKRLLGAL